MKILILSHYFEPYKLVGARRMSSLVRFLAGAGHEICVLKASNELYAGDIDPDTAPIENVETFDVKPGKASNSWTGWIRAYKKAIDDVTVGRNFDIALICGGPFNYFLTGPYMKRKYGIPYILDFRDVAAHKLVAPGAVLYRTGPRRLLVFVKNRLIEALSVRKASRIVATSPKMEEFYRDRFPKHRGRMLTIYNGYDDAALASFERKEPDRSSLSIGIFGKFTYYGNEHVKILKEALTELEHEGISHRIVHIGAKEPVVEKELASLNYVHYETLPYSKGMSVLSSCRALAVSHYQKEAIATKVFDYMYLNHPVIAFLPEDSDSKLLLSQFEHAYFPQTSEELSGQLRYIYEQDITQLSAEIEDIAQYSRRSQNTRYRDLLETVIGES
ncbi:MAG: glycosyltransferase family 4 protein [Fastidiosipila sp.]|nr:glycosyltransferase family 4 protein [Fastidiosipila sp.]